ncbi:hypothetical protein NLI96_g7079 [Meripilus lineatus]|uniref:Thioredoxin domain-containing protein n=1 Tax=Meripilus lineatus TaxID=2056292 RepID=A0AAD5V1K9_9APHY|nr:hypothetical protein NLI96_g7079 [Physisporinus lineatus]
MPIQDISSIQQFKDVIQTGAPVMIVFWVEWCEPSKAIIPFFARLSDTYQDFSFAKVDVKELPELAEEMGIRVTPTFIFFENGHTVTRVVGAYPVQVEVCVSFSIPLRQLEEAKIQKKQSMVSVFGRKLINTVLRIHVMEFVFGMLFPLTVRKSYTQYKPPTVRENPTLSSYARPRTSLILFFQSVSSCTIETFSACAHQVIAVNIMEMFQQENQGRGHPQPCNPPSPPASSMPSLEGGEVVDSNAHTDEHDEQSKVVFHFSSAFGTRATDGRPGVITREVDNIIHIYIFPSEPRSTFGHLKRSVSMPADVEKLLYLHD